MKKLASRCLLKSRGSSALDQPALPVRGIRTSAHAIAMTKSGTHKIENCARSAIHLRVFRRFAHNRLATKPASCICLSA